MTNAAKIVLLGDPVEHSLSPVFQGAGLAALGLPWGYGARRVNEDGARAAFEEIRDGRLLGANVTAPHKGLAWSAVDRRTPVAERTGAVNTLWLEGGELWGDNTDVLGIQASLEALGANPDTAVVLGAGGAAAALVVALEHWPRVRIVNRSLARAEELVRVHGQNRPGWQALDWQAVSPQIVEEATLVVNATPLRAQAQARERFGALPLASLSDSCALFDLSYARSRTPFLSLFPATRPQLDGATMLLHQGIASLERWTGKTAPRGSMEEALVEALGRPLSSSLMVEPRP